MAKSRARQTRTTINQPHFYRLPNGLRVVLQQTDFAPVVSMALWVTVGSADEKPSETGLAHVFEHMIFKGTERRGVGQIAAEVEDAGGEINAFTSYDQTCFYINLGKDEYRQGLDILADAIQNAAFDRTELANEIQVILEELALYRDVPEAHLAEQAMARTFRVHPYGRPIIGLEEVLNKLRRADIMRFYHRHYRPDRMVLSVVGDFPLAQIKASITRLFGKMPGQTSRLASRRPEPKQNRFRSLIMHDRVNQAHLHLLWHGPKWNGALAAELDLLAMVLGGGESSRLQNRIKSTRGLVNSISAHLFSPTDPGVFTVEAAMKPAKVSAATDAILREVYRARESMVGKKELERVKKNLEAAFIGRHETAGGTSQILGYSVALTGDIHLEKEYLERVRTATRVGLRQAARKYLNHGNFTLAMLLPKGEKLTRSEIEGVAQKAHRACFHAPSISDEVPRLSAPAVQLSGSEGRRGRLKRVVLPNGIRLIVKESAHAPFVAIRTCMLGGTRYEKPKQNGISNLTARLLSRGTREKSALQFAKEVEGMAGGIRGISGYNSIGVAAEFLSRDFQKGMELTAEAMLEASFRPQQISRQKQIIRGQLRRKKDDLHHLVRDLFADTLYGKHPYGRTLQGTEKTLARIDRQAIKKFWRSLLDPADLVIAIAGDVRWETAVEQAELLYGGLRPKGFTPLTFPDPAPPSGKVLREEVLPKEQAHILLGFLGCRIGSPDEYALQLLNAALSGQGGRLFLELRDRMHLAYQVYSFHREGIERGSFGAYIGTSNQFIDLALSALIGQIKNAIEKPPQGRELARAKRYLIGSMRLDLQTNGSLALAIGLNELLGPGHRAHLRYADKVKRVTDEKMRQVVQRYLSTDDMVIAMIHGK